MRPSGANDRSTTRSAPVSVVVPCYRCRDTVAAAVASIAAQTLPPAEVLLVDDSSRDGTLEELRWIATNHPRDWIRVIALTDNGGPSRARNVGWRHASQEYIAFLDADDTWLPQKLETQMQVLGEDPRIALIAHRMQVRERGSPMPAAPLRRRPRVTIVGRRRMLLSNPFPTASVVLRRDLPFRFNEDFRRVEDFLLWAQIAFSGYRCARIEQVLALWHKPNYGVGGLSADLRAMHRAGREARLELLRQGLVSLPEHLFARTVGVVRKGRQRLVAAMRDARRRRSTS